MVVVDPRKYRVVTAVTLTCLVPSPALSWVSRAAGHLAHLCLLTWTWRTTLVLNNSSGGTLVYIRERYTLQTSIIENYINTSFQNQTIQNGKLRWY